MQKSGVFLILSTNLAAIWLGHNFKSKRNLIVCCKHLRVGLVLVSNQPSSIVKK